MSLVFSGQIGTYTLSHSPTLEILLLCYIFHSHILYEFMVLLHAHLAVLH